MAAAATAPRYAPVSKESVADDDDDDTNGSEALVARGREASDADAAPEDGEAAAAAASGGGFTGCDCLTQLIARGRAGRQHGYAAPEDGVTEPLTQARKRVLLRHYILLKMHQFANTGSGQT